MINMIVNCIIDENSIRWHNEKGREFVVDISASDKMLFNEKQILCISKDNETAWAFDENGHWADYNYVCDGK